MVPDQGDIHKQKIQFAGVLAQAAVVFDFDRLYDGMTRPLKRRDGFEKRAAL